jgi:ATP-dependent DNA ligase
LSELHAAIEDQKTTRSVYFVFDLFYFDGYRLDRATLLDRKVQLARNMKSPADDRLRYTLYHLGQGPEFSAQVKNMPGVEGIVSRRRVTHIGQAEERPG